MVKRLFDILASAAGIVVLWPLFVLSAILIWKDDNKGPLFFKQVRVGQNGRPFEILKFRTMSVTKSQASTQVTQASDSRITRPGRLLRKWKLDELPQLVNVLKGDMSIVGPRPEVPYFMEKYPDRQRKIILSMKPGITDLAAIEFRNEQEILQNYEDIEKAYIDIIMPIKFRLYNKYSKKKSLFFDIKIIFLTLKNIILR
ncbi:MAG: sugar transferase [Sphingomonadales bacterium]|jgi:lipopolysaccharide/colanic/teichoic acid biosynthesis glycosyltransferase|nr:sugar transferase [Sphingomonadales bacterium]MBK9004878.1 sugar transferase [Sphingomonadales bacterium]MBK9267392.1 sugar transferase [Sphingomonadales bacterium]